MDVYFGSTVTSAERKRLWSFAHEGDADDTLPLSPLRVGSGWTAQPSPLRRDGQRAGARARDDAAASPHSTANDSLISLYAYCEDAFGPELSSPRITRTPLRPERLEESPLKIFEKTLLVEAESFSDNERMSARLEESRKSITMPGAEGGDPALLRQSTASVRNIDNSNSSAAIPMETSAGPVTQALAVALTSKSESSIYPKNDAVFPPSGKDNTKITKAPKRPRPTISRAGFPSPGAIMRAADKSFGEQLLQPPIIAQKRPPSPVLPQPVVFAEPTEPTSATITGPSAVKRAKISRLPTSRSAAVSRLEKGTISSKSKHADVAAATSMNPAPVRKAAQLTQAQLVAITNQNTARNRQLYNRHEVLTVHKDEARPPSPSEKLRKIMDPVDSESRQARASNRDALRESLTLQPEENPKESRSNSHYHAPGDEEEGYQSPLKRKSQNPSKLVKWDRSLVDAIPEKPRKKISLAKRRPVNRPALAARADLDALGNHPDAKLPLSPFVPRSVVQIARSF